MGESAGVEISTSNGNICLTGVFSPCYRLLAPWFEHGVFLCLPAWWLYVKTSVCVDLGRTDERREMIKAKKQEPPKRTVPNKPVVQDYDDEDDDIFDLVEVLDVSDDLEDELSSGADVEFLDVDSDLDMSSFDEEKPKSVSGRGGGEDFLKGFDFEDENGGSSGEKDLFGSGDDDILKDLSFLEDDGGKVAEDMDVASGTSDDDILKDLSFLDEDAGTQPPKSRSIADTSGDDILKDLSFLDDDAVGNKGNDNDILKDLSFLDEKDEALDPVADLFGESKKKPEPVPAPKAKPPMNVVAKAAVAPGIGTQDDAAVDAFVTQIESRLLSAVQEIVEGKLPEIVRALLREEIEKLKEEMMR